jgi:bifunctional DNA-binding transcriptional regulator/antitoxin component of YhaV-PrlF toxin-antitoxin module
MKKEIEVRKVNMHGQITIGKELAGQQVQIERQDDNVFIITKGQFIPANERWLHQGDNIERLNRAIAESKSSPLIDNFEEVKKKILSDE